MAIAFSASDDRSVYAPGLSIVTDAGIDVAAGDLVVVTLFHGDSSTVTVQDDASPPNTFTVLTERGGSNFAYSRIAYCVITTAKTGALFTASFGTSQTGRVNIAAMKFTKAAGETWNADGGNFGLNSYAATVSSGTFTTSYADAVSVGIGWNTGGGGTWPTTNIGNAAATVTPDPQAGDQSVFFYRLHGAITDCDADLERSAPSWLGVQFHSFGVTGAASAIKTILGLAKASVKTVNGLAIASVKAWDGLA